MKKKKEKSRKYELIFMRQKVHWMQASAFFIFYENIYYILLI